MSDCERIQAMLDDLVDGLLEAGVESEVRSHLSRCLACRRALLELEALLSRTRRLDAEIAPQKDLWPGIAARLGPAGRRRPGGLEPPAATPRRWRYLAAAAAALLVASVPISMWWIGRGPGIGAPIARSPETDPAAEVAERAIIARVEDGALKPRSDLIELLERRRDILDDETLAALEDSARLLDSAIGEIGLALDRYPDNRRLSLQLAAHYQKEVELLKILSHT